MNWKGGRTIYKGTKIDLVVVPVDENIESAIIVHPGAAVILPLMPDSTVVMIRNRRIAVQESLLELPAGTISPPESPEDCAKRELAEETGYRSDSLEFLGAFYSAPGISTEIMHSYLALNLEDIGQSLEPDETITVEYQPMQKIHKMILNGEIRDSKTLSTFLLYWERHGFKNET